MLYDNDKIYIVGLTGMSGAGKTTACRVFADRGFHIIDCDGVAREVVEKGAPALDEIAGYFGKEILDSDGSLDRKKLGGIVFGDKQKLAALDSIIYPYISYRIIKHISSLDGIVILDAPTLFESGADALCDAIVSVTADRETSMERIMQRDGLTREQAEKRLSSQSDAQFYRERSDFTADNNGSSAEFGEKLTRIAGQITEMYHDMTV